MRVVFECHSQNGRWGAEVVSASPVARWPVRGTIRALGSAGCRDAFELLADDTAATWVLATQESGHMEVVQGATEVWAAGLQGNGSAGIFLLGPQALMKSVGYKGRTAHYVLYVEGVVQSVSVAELLQAGVIAPREPPQEIAPPPPPSAALLGALAKIGRRP